MTIQVVILAGGQGKRMQSALPKVLHHLGGKALLEHVIEAAQAVSSKKPLIVHGHQGDLVKQELSHNEVDWVEQKEQLGTGHALQQAISHIPDSDQVLVLSGDVPLISKDTLKRLIDSTPKNTLGILTATIPEPTGYGRIKRNQKQDIVRIIEEKDATDEEKTITEINPGIYLAPASRLKKWLPTLKNHNMQKEYYLTDIIPLAISQHVSIHAVSPRFPEEILGVNDRAQLAQLERCYQMSRAKKLMEQGVTIVDPSRLDIRGDVEIGKDVTIDINVILEGRVVIGDGCHIGPHTILRHTILGKSVEIKANSLLDGVEIGSECVIGPYARLRPGVILSSGVKIGNFVEVKNSKIGEHSKVNHLSYIGDALIGKEVNVGAGTITCNYDGVNKHQTIIEDQAFIGSNTSLVAPVKIGEGATIGAGSTITKDAAAQKLTLSRVLQETIANWRRPKKKDK